MLRPAALCLALVLAARGNDGLDPGRNQATRFRCANAVGAAGNDRDLSAQSSQLAHLSRPLWSESNATPAANRPPV